MEKSYHIVRTGQKSDELYHWKYIKKEKKNGKWRYYYDKDQLGKDVKSKFDSIYYNPNNIYDVSARNYDSKVAKIMETDEWKDIVRRKDPEYVRTTKDGQTKYLIDEYLVKKKHPELDIIDDLGAGRKISLNEVNFDTFVAGAKDYITSAQQMIGVVAKGLTEKFKLQQGSYKDDINGASNEISSGISFVSKLFKIR